MFLSFWNRRADTRSIDLNGGTTVAAIQSCQGWCGAKNVNRTVEPAGGISANFAAILDGSAPLGQLIDSTPPQRLRVEAGLRRPCDGYTVPTDEPNTYLGGMLCKIDQSGLIYNCTFG
jgi:hypothetical protein